MAIQDFTAGQVLTAAQMDSLQANDYNQTVSTKTANYTLVAADKGTRVVMNAAGATTITVNTSLFTAGDTLFLQNIGAGVCTVTAGTATVTSSASLALPQYGGGLLYFTSASASIFLSASTGAGKQIQAVQTLNGTGGSTSSTSFASTGITATITPTAASSKVLVLATVNGAYSSVANYKNTFTVFRGTTAGTNLATASANNSIAISSLDASQNSLGMDILDSPNTTSAQTYTIAAKIESGGTAVNWNYYDVQTSLTLIEIGV